MAFGEAVSWDYFQVLGVPMALGRSFLPEEDATPGSHPVTIWATARGCGFDRNPRCAGTDVRLNGVSFTIVGVAPEAFTGTLPVLVTGFYAPLMMTDALMGEGSAGQLERRTVGACS